MGTQTIQFLSEDDDATLAIYKLNTDYASFGIDVITDEETITFNVSKREVAELESFLGVAPKPVVFTKYKDDDRHLCEKCPTCGTGDYWDVVSRWKFCPGCGTKIIKQPNFSPS